MLAEMKAAMNEQSRPIDHLASAIILVHNHPSGNLNPSVQDDNLTRKLKEAGQIVEIPVIDHLIAATTPIIPKVIKTSDNVNAQFFFIYFVPIK